MLLVEFSLECILKRERHTLHTPRICNRKSIITTPYMLKLIRNDQILYDWKTDSCIRAPYNVRSLVHEDSDSVVQKNQTVLDWQTSCFVILKPKLSSDLLWLRKNTFSLHSFYLCFIALRFPSALLFCLHSHFLFFFFVASRLSP